MFLWCCCCKWRNCISFWEAKLLVQGPKAVRQPIFQHSPAWQQTLMLNLFKFFLLIFSKVGDIRIYLFFRNVNSFPSCSINNSHLKLSELLPSLLGQNSSHPKLKGGEAYFGLHFSPLWGSMAGGMMQESCSRHGRQEARRGKGGAGREVSAFGPHPKWLTSTSSQQISYKPS